MGSKYMINCSKYPYTGIDKRYHTGSFLKALIFILKAKSRYEIINFEIRDFEKMDKEKGNG